MLVESSKSRLNWVLLLLFTPRVQVCIPPKHTSAQLIDSLYNEATGAGQAGEGLQCIMHYDPFQGDKTSLNVSMLTRPARLRIFLFSGWTPFHCFEGRAGDV